jgi:EAL domain-containing protein (putative c-di-GMP-specific phosphodiesterase class I)
MDREVILELTEHEVVTDYARIRDVARALGPRVSLAVDDAGAGYASMRHILELHPSTIKVDLGIVRGIDGDPARQALVAGLQFFAEQVGCIVVAEGIETEAERATLAKLGVGHGQGYFFGRPRPIDEMAA